jgi:hypothetical protein
VTRLDGQVAVVTEPGKENVRWVEATIKRTPVRRWGHPAGLRDIAAYLADPRLAFHTGDSIVIEGGTRSSDLGDHVLRLGQPRRGTLGVVGALVPAGADPADGEVAAVALDAEDLTVADEDLAAVAGAVDAHHDRAPSVRRWRVGRWRRVKRWPGRSRSSRRMFASRMMVSGCM